MNYSAMTDMELIHYLDLYATDPLIRRLASMLVNTRGALVAELENAGMDPETWEFEADYQSLYPGDYIMYLRRTIDSLESDLRSAEYNLEEVIRERDELKTRTIMDFVEEVMSERRTNAFLVQEAEARVQVYKNENADLKEKIDMWGRMNQVKQGV